jgi:putative cell wall-binding protein
MKSLAGDYFKSVIFVNGFKGEEDAMSVATVATRDNAPIILTDGKSTSYKGIYLKSYVIVEENSMSNDIARVTDSKRIDGNDRFDTNENIIREFYKNSTEFYVSKAYNLVDSLTGSSLAKNKPIVLVDAIKAF